MQCNILARHLGVRLVFKDVSLLLPCCFAVPGCAAGALQSSRRDFSSRFCPWCSPGLPRWWLCREGVLK